MSNRCNPCKIMILQDKMIPHEFFDFEPSTPPPPPLYWGTTFFGGGGGDGGQKFVLNGILILILIK